VAGAAALCWKPTPPERVPQIRVDQLVEPLAQVSEQRGIWQRLDDEQGPPQSGSAGAVG